MKTNYAQRRTTFLGFLASIGLFTLLGLSTATADAADTISIAVEQAPIRSRASALGRPIATAYFGDTVERVTPARSWVLVRTTEGVEGYLHNSAIAKQRPSVRLGGSGGPIGSQGGVGGVVLAGKGFGNDVVLEDQNLPYDILDRLEATRVDDTRIESFLSERGLR